MIRDLLNFIKVVFTVILIIITVIAFLIALPTIIEQAKSDRCDQPYSGATPDCPLHLDDEDPWDPHWNRK